MRGKAQTKSSPGDWLNANPRYIVSNNGMVVDCSTYFRVLPSEQGFESHRPTIVQSAEQRVETAPLRLKAYISESVALEAGLGGQDSTAGLPVARGNWMAVPVSEPGRSRLLLFCYGRGGPRVECHLNGSASPVVRLTDKLCVADEHGRIYVIDLDSGRVLRNIRL